MKMTEVFSPYAGKSPNWYLFLFLIFLNTNAF